MALTPGKTLGAFEITGLLGKGGMGEVYRVKDTKLGRDVAIKVLSGAVADDPSYLPRFEREANFLALLHHPKIGVLFDFQQPGDVYFLVLQLVEGETLGDRNAQNAGCPVKGIADNFLALVKKIFRPVVASEWEILDDT